MHTVVWVYTPWLIGRPDYVITMPNMYARGILFGKMVLELGDTCVARNEKQGLLCDLEFKTKVTRSHTYLGIIPDVQPLGVLFRNL